MNGLILISLVCCIAAINAAVISTPELSAAALNGLNKHNELRALHRTEPLKLNQTLNNVAQAYAEYLAANNLFQHSSDAMTGKYGENLYYTCSYPTTPLIETSTVAGSQAWYDEISMYDFSKPGFTYSTGHFTALVWKSTTDVGFGVAVGKKPSGSYVFNCVYVVANYWKPGNINTPAYFEANVLRLQ